MEQEQIGNEDFKAGVESGRAAERARLKKLVEEAMGDEEQQRLNERGFNSACLWLLDLIKDSPN